MVIQEYTENTTINYIRINPLITFYTIIKPLLRTNKSKKTYFQEKLYVFV